MRKPTPKLYIFDVDGTLRWTHTSGQRYPLSADDWSLMPNVASALKAIPWSDNGPWLALASNQPGVSEGLLTASEARAMMVAAVRAAIGHVPAQTQVEMCTCRDESQCKRQKPNDGMLLKLLHHFRIEPADALYVGDQPIDAEAARRAGIPFIWANIFFDLKL